MQLANGIFAGDIALSRVADDLVVALRGTSDSVAVRNHFVGSSAGGHQIDLIRFADGSAWDVTAIAALAGAVNRSPIVSTPLADQSSLEDSSFSFVVPINTFSDPDAGDVLTLSAKLASGANLPSWLSFNAGTRTFGGTPLNVDVGVWSIQVAAIDQVGASVVDTFDLGVVNTNDPPEALDDSRSVLENATTGNLTAGLLANDNDVDGGDRKTIVAVDSTASMGMVSFDRAAQLLTYAANGAALDALRAGATTVDTFAYTMTDAAGATSTATASVTVMGVNDAPTLVGPVPDRVAIAGTPFNFAVLPGAFVDVDAGDVLSYAAGLAGDTALPSWLSFDAATQTFSGTPADADVRTWTVSLTARDGSEASARDTFDIAVKGVNHAPLLTNPIPVQSANADAAFTFITPADTFTDVDIGDTLTYGAGLASGAALPAWLAFDAATRTFSGTPHAGDIGRISLKLIATDGGDASASDVFDLTVSKAEDVIHIVPTTLVPILENATSANLAPSLFAHSSEAGLGETRAITGVDATGTLGVVRFDAATQTLTYAANGAALDALPAGVTYTDSFSYTLADAAGDRATSNVAMVVTGANDAPMLVAALADQDVTPGDSLDFQLPAAAFTDSDTGDAMSYAATLADGSSLPAWMSFDATSRSFSCDVPASNFADVNIKVTATDTGGMSASDLFALRMVTPDGGPIGWPLGDDDPWYPRRAGIGLRTVAAIHQGGATSDNFALGRHTSALIEAMAAFDAPAGGPLHMGSAHLFNTMPVIASPLSI